ncbi:MAG: sulfotransferase domain-containing protein [Thermoplasmatota archaeon]
MYGFGNCLEYLLNSKAYISNRIIRGTTLLWNRTKLQYRLMSLKGNLPEHKVQLLKKQSDLVLGGYGGSANGFTYQLINLISDELKIAHHTYQIGLIRIAIREKIPVIVNIRRPEMAISSVMVRFERDEVCWDLARYINYHSYLLNNSDDILFLDFKDITENTEKSVEKIEKFTGYNFSTQNLQQKEEIALSRLPNKSKPSEERDEKKQNLRKIIPEHSLYRKALKLYNKCLRY